MNLEEQQVLNLFQELLNKYDKQGSREVRNGHSRVSLFGKQLRFDLSKSFPLLTHRQFFVRGIFEELMWMLRGQTDNKILEDKKVYIWSPWNGIINPNYKTDMGLIYGHQWRKFGEHNSGIHDPHNNGEYDEYKPGFDQIEWVVNEIKTNPSSSRLIVSGWNPNDIPKAVLPCCHTLFQFFVEDMNDKERIEQAMRDYGHNHLADLYTKYIEDNSITKALYPKLIQEVLDSIDYPRSKLSCQLYQRKLVRPFRVI